MGKKIAIVGGLGAFLFVSILASAQKEKAPATSGGSILGALEGTMNFCGKVDPQSASKYEDLKKLLTNGQSNEAVAKIRESKEYKDSLDQTNKQLGALSPKEAVAACKGSGSK